MASVTENLQQILSARYGKDVRQSIHDSIKELDGVAKTAQDSATANAHTAIERANEAVTASQVASASAELAKTYAERAEAATGIKKATQETTSTTLPDSNSGRLKINEIGGVMEQDSTTGKNLMPVNDVTFTGTKGITFEKPLPTGTYTISAEIVSSDTDSNLCRVLFYSGSTEAGYLFLARGSRVSGKIEAKSEITSLLLYASDSYSGSNGDTATWNNIQIEAGSTMTTYEPYTGGQPAPNPQFPSEIRKSVVSGIKTIWKNLAKSILPNVTTQWSVALYVDCNLKPSTQYTISFNGNSGNTYYLNENLFESAGYIYVTNERMVVTFTTKNELPKNESTYSESAGWIFLKNSIAQPKDNVFAEFQLEEGAATEYEPYTESVITFSQPIDIYGKDDVRDILTSKQIGRKYAKVVFDGSDDEAWNGSSTIGRYYMNNFGCKGYGILMCSYAKGVQNGNELINTCYIHAASNGRFIINTEIPTMAEWKAHLASNPMTVVFELAEETTEELPIADQIALNSLQTFDGITYVEFVSDVQPTYKAEYGTSKEGGYTLESLLLARNNDLRISALEA